MRLSFFVFLILGTAQFCAAQLTGTKHIPGDYATITAAVAALNTSGVGSGGVTFAVAADYTETITATISITATGTAANPIVFQKDPLTSGNNPLITSYTGGTGTPASAVQDGIWRLVGSDYLTIDGIDLLENPLNSGSFSTMEYGYALYKGSTTNGCKFVMIRNCTISLSRENDTAGVAPMVDGSCGILLINAIPTAATSALTASTGGASTDNRFYSNTVKNCNTGIALIGYAASTPFTNADINNDVGGNSLSTGNTIVNYGGAAGALTPAVAIRASSQRELNISYNTINSNNGAGVNHPQQLRGILLGTASSTNATISYNTITLKGGGTTQLLTAIENATGSTALGNTVSISNNTITNCTYTSATTGGFYGIYNTATPAVLNITYNTISNNSSAAKTSAPFYGVYNTATAPLVNISNNSFTGNSADSMTTGLFCPFYNSASAPAVSMNNNTISGNTTKAVTGLFYAFYNRGTATGTITFTGNSIGTVSTPAVTFTSANSGAHVMINNNRGGPAAALTITNNSFYGAGYTIAGTGSFTAILNGAATLSQTITGNTFNNLSVNTAGSLTFISNSVALPTGGSQQISNNSIVGTFTKAAGGTVTLLSSSATCAAGTTITHSGNNFSNITVTGATIIAGWTMTDGGNSTRIVENNTFSNWTGGTSAITAMSVNNTGAGNATRNNVIYNITSGGSIIGITTGAGNDNIYKNTIYGLSNTGAAAINGITITGGTQKNVHDNKIYNLQAGILGGTVYGIVASGTTGAVVQANIYNNLIGDLRAPLASAADPVRGISLTSTRANSTLNIYYNTIYLSATSSGTNFGTSGIYHAGSATSTTAVLNLKNNIIANYSTANGTGLVVALRRGTDSLNNYHIASNNNLLYAGTPGPKNLIYYASAAGSDQTINAFKSRMSPRETNSVTEDIFNAFLSVSGASSNFLHLNTTVSTQAESGGSQIAILDDFDDNLRYGDTSYTGTGVAPDIGADEFEGIRALPLSGTYTVGTGGNYTSLTKTGGLFAALNSLGVNDDVDVNIISDLTEDGSNALNQWEEHGTGTHSVTIQPSSATVRTISGSAASGLIRLNGADRLVIDGSAGTSGKYLTFRNTNASGTTATAFTLVNGATGNTISNCTIEAYANSTNGVMLFSTSTGTVGNSDNVISNCDINATVSGNTGNVAIYSAGTVGKENSSNSISSCNIYNYRDRGIDLASTGSTGWTISGNSCYNGSVSSLVDYAAATTLQGIRILGGAGYTITNNYVGGSSALAAGAQAVYSSSTGLLTCQGILLTTTASTPTSNIKGNTVANISVSAIPSSTASAGSNVFHGIETNGSGINIGGTGTGEGNTVGSTGSNGSIAVTTTTALTTHRSNVRGIACGSTGGQIIANKVGGFDITNVGAGPGPTTFSGVYVSSASAPSQVNNNLVGSGTTANSIRVVTGSNATGTNLHGISLAATVTSTVQVDGNTVRDLSILSTAASSGNITGINTAVTGAAAITISSNTIRDNYFNLLAAGSFYGIRNTGAAATIAITGNTIASMSSNAVTGVYNAIFNSGAITSSLSVTGNNIGTTLLDAFTFNVANSGAQIFINNTAGASSSSFSISNNTFRRINYVAASTAANTLILNSAATLSQVISGNVFSALDVNSSGSLTFISNSVAVSGTGTQNVNNNSISTSFTKRAGGTITLFTSSLATASGGVVNNSNNNFSNITVTGATTIAGWVRTDAGAGEKNIENNTFSNWSGGTSAITVMNVNLSGSSSHVSGNILSNISGASTINGISTAAGEDYIHNNTISGLYSTGASIVTAINVTAGTIKRIYRNKIYDLQANNAGGSVNGITISGSALPAASIYNNLIGDLKAPSASSSSDAIRGINITATTANATFNVYYNTVYLNATSTGTNFHTSCIYHASSATATTAVLNLRNNSLTNLSTPKGSGVTAVLRRGTAGAMANYASTSNNNLFYAGTPGAARVIYYYTTPTASDQTISAFQTRAAPADAQSITEDLSGAFLSTTGTSPLFLHINESVPTLVESGGQNISGFTDDFDAQIRQGNPGYSGTGYAPDIGADEIFGIEVIPPAISYTALTNTTSTANRSLTGVTITDGSGVNTTAGTKPRIYYKRSTDANTFVDNTAGTNGWKFTEATNSSSPFSFTINYSLLYGSNSTAGVIQYFIVAQDVSTPANVAINSGAFAVDPASVALTAAAFPVTGTINSYQIPFSGSIEVGTGKAFTSLTKTDGVFGVINTVGLMGTTTLSVTSDLTEDGTNALNQWAESGAGNYQLIIKSDNEVLKTVSGDAATGLIRLNGADRVRIDGSSSGTGPYLLFRNTNTAGGDAPAIRFAEGASYDTVKYSTLEAYTGASSGVVVFGGSSSSGNSNIAIENSTINATVNSNTGVTGIYSGGTAGLENSSNRIAASDIKGYGYQGIDITAVGSAGWTITGNSIYNGAVSSAISYPDASAVYGIRILGGAGYSLQGNYIGGSAASAGGTNAVYTSATGNVSVGGIQLTTGTGSASTIKGNTITRMTVNSVPLSSNAPCFTGIETNGTSISIGGTGVGEGNLIGSNTTLGAIAINTTTANSGYTSLVRGISCNSTGTTISGNQVAGVDIINAGASPAGSQFTGIYVNAATAPAQISGNIVGSYGTGAASNSIRVRLASAATNHSINCILLSPVVASTVSLTNNIISNVTVNSATSSGTFGGIVNHASSSAFATISGNQIATVTAAVNSGSGSGLYTAIETSSPSDILNNTIDNVVSSATGTASQVRGIWTQGNYSFNISGNTISRLYAASTKAADLQSGSPQSFTVLGILNEGQGSSQVIYNNVLSDFRSTTTANTATTVAGIITANGGGAIYRNKIVSFGNTATGTSTLPGIGGVFITGGDYNIYNNVVSISNGTNTNGTRLFGMLQSSTGTCRYYYNTVSISGNATGTAAKNTAFIRTASGSVVLQNNIFVNSRTGTGSNYAICNVTSPAATNWTAGASDYNDIHSLSASTTGEWGSGNNTSFAQWQAASGGDSHSANRSVTFLASTYDLQPDAGTNCALDNAGTTVSTPIAITVDINNATRNVTTPDIGAYEFSYTPFAIDATSNTPVCAGGTVDLAADPGDAILPTYSWRNPLYNTVASTQNPTVAAYAGQYKLTVTDVNGCFITDSTAVSLITRPTGSISGGDSICLGSTIVLNIAVTGTGVIDGELNTGDVFSGTAPLITVSVEPSATTTYSIVELSDNNCSSLPADITDTEVVTVMDQSIWTGAVSTDWYNSANWRCGNVPDPETDVVIRAATRQPVISTGTASAKSIYIASSAQISLSSTLEISGGLSGSGTISAASGHIVCNGSAAQSIPANFFTSNTIRNLTVNNSAGVTLLGALNVSGIVKSVSGTLASAGYLSLLSTASGCALIDGSGGGTVSGNVTMQRYLSSGYGYKYVSSPFQSATVGEFAQEVDLDADFPTFYAHDENQETSGWIDYTDESGSLQPLIGYAANFGDQSSPKTVSLTGIVSNGTISLSALYNHNKAYTQGFHLVGNPYPSPIDWNAGAGWTKSNIDNAIYYFNAGSSDQFAGSYSSYINGVSSDGVAGSIVPSMQGFFIHVSNGSFPVLGSLTVNNAARTNNLTPVFHKTSASAQSVIRLQLMPDGDSLHRDQAAVYFDEEATASYDKELDALKLLNTDERYPNLYAYSSDMERLSIASVPSPAGNEDMVIPLGIKCQKSGAYVFTLTSAEHLPKGMSIFLADRGNGSVHKLSSQKQLFLNLQQGTNAKRFFLIFSRKNKVSMPAVSNEAMAYVSGSSLFVVAENDGEVLSMYNMSGQKVLSRELHSNGLHEVGLHFATGVYIVVLNGSEGKRVKKIYVSKQ